MGRSARESSWLSSDGGADSSDGAADSAGATSDRRARETGDEAPGPPTFRLERWTRPTQGELALLAGFERAAFGETGLRSYDLGVVARAGGLLVAVVDDSVVGCCQLLRMYDDPGIFWVVGFWIRPEWRGRGLGAAVLSAVIDVLPQAGGCGLELTVDPGNGAALRLYQRFGFRVVERVTDFYGPGEDRLVLRFEGMDGDDREGGDFGEGA